MRVLLLVVLLCAALSTACQGETLFRAYVEADNEKVTRAYVAHLDGDRNELWGVTTSMEVDGDVYNMTDMPLFPPEDIAVDDDTSFRFASSAGAEGFCVLPPSIVVTDVQGHAQGDGVVVTVDRSGGASTREEAGVHVRAGCVSEELVRGFVLDGEVHIPQWAVDVRDTTRCTDDARCMATLDLYATHDSDDATSRQAGGGATCARVQRHVVSLPCSFASW